MPLTLKGIGSPRVILQADSSNAGPVFVGNRYENGPNGVIATLDASNNLDTLLPGQGHEYGDFVANDRLPKTRDYFIEANYRHIMSEWYVNGTIGDLVIVNWLDENIGTIHDTDGLPIDVTSLDR